MYLYCVSSFGFPHSLHSHAVSGMVSSNLKKKKKKTFVKNSVLIIFPFVGFSEPNIVWIASVKGTSATTTRKSFGAIFVTAQTNRPPAEIPGKGRKIPQMEIDPFFSESRYYHLWQGDQRWSIAREPETEPNRWNLCHTRVNYFTIPLSHFALLFVFVFLQSIPLNVFILCINFPFSLHQYPISPPPRTWAKTYTKPLPSTVRWHKWHVRRFFYRL